MNSPLFLTHLSDPWQWKLCLHSRNLSSASSAMSMSATSTTSLIPSTAPTWLALRPVAPSAASWLANWGLFVGLLDGRRPNSELTNRPKNLNQSFVMNLYVSNTGYYPFWARLSLTRIPIRKEKYKSLWKNQITYLAKSEFTSHLMFRLLFKVDLNNNSKLNTKCTTISLYTITVIHSHHSQGVQGISAQV